MDPLLRDVLTLLAFCGATLVLTRGFIFKRVRDRFEARELLYELVRCPLCTGAWLGAAGWILRCWILYPLGIEHFAEALIVGLATALISAAVGGADARG